MDAREIQAVAMKMSRVWAMPSSDTFDIPPIREFVYRYLDKGQVSIDPFARNKRWATFTNDLNPQTDAEYHMDALDFLRMLKAQGVKADLVIFDPPYSIRQILECYKNVGRDSFSFKDHETLGRWQQEKDLCEAMLGIGGVFLNFGWSSYGLGSKRGFAIEEILLVAHGSCRNDTICTAERRIQSRLF